MTIKNEHVSEIRRPDCSSTTRIYESELFDVSKGHNVTILSINNGYRYKCHSYYFSPNAIIENDQDCWDLLYRFRKSELSDIVLALIKDNKKDAFQAGRIEMQNQLKSLLFGD